MQITEALLSAARANPEKVALRHENGSLTYGALNRQACRIAEFLVDRSASGRSVLLVFPAGLDFLPAFLGCLYAGALAVPAAQPTRQDSANRLTQIASDCDAVIGLTVREFAPKLAAVSRLEWVSVEDLASGDAPTRILASDPIAYLQYTSGSTSFPRGVEVTQAGLLHNLRCIVAALELGPSDVCVTWLPHYHDMGLIGTLLAPLFAGGTSVVLSPFDFVQAPMRWLRALSKFRGTFTASPNFGYELCVRRTMPAERAELDLSAWRVAANGSETVRAETVGRFVEAFAPVGFQSKAMAPCYGLAEATLIVSMSRQGASSVGFDQALLSQGGAQPASGENAVMLVGCGKPVVETEIAIVDPTEQSRQAPNVVGEIWVRSESVAKGYYKRAKETSAFQAQIKNEAGAYLRTGDLGFMYNDELFVTGRIKDVVVVRGRKIHPQDIESVAQAAHPALRANRAVAFSADDGDEEGVVILQEVKASLDSEQPHEAIGKIREAINRAHGIDPMEIVLLPRQTIALTSSGKLARWESRLAWAERRTEPIARWRRKLA
jgi:acyl-CoA synthetase (AMP-forming)/AMP-acid ligase II